MPDLAMALREATRRGSWTPARMTRLVEQLPKVETHLHLDGALSPETPPPPLINLAEGLYSDCGMRNR